MDKRIVVVGAGAIGGYTGGNLAHNGFDVTIVDPRSTFIDSRATIGPDTVVLPFTYIHGPVTIGPRCRIGPFAHDRPHLESSLRFAYLNAGKQSLTLDLAHPVQELMTAARYLELPIAHAKSLEHFWEQAIAAWGQRFG